ncbi:MAG: HAD family hydrolase [Verrucomicrobiota bacterium]
MRPELIELVVRHSKEVAPRPTSVRARLPVLEGLRAVVFDIYGTLMVSGTGDISLADAGDQDELLFDVLRDFGLEPEPDVSPASCYLQCIQKEHARRKEEGISFPEVEIREIWKELLSFCQGSEVGPERLEELALIYECRINPVWPMPGFVEVMNDLNSRRLKLGIVSNAQFYTPALFPALTGRSLSQWGVDSALCVWSFEEREGKPSRNLFRKCAAALAKEGIQPGEALFVGNDYRKDVEASAAVGFRTALFAGDTRSLRPRDYEDDGVPDAILTDLRQIPVLLGAER